MPDWSLLQTPNFGQAALGGYQAGYKLGKQRQVDAALQIYAKDPAAGISALSGVDPVMAHQLATAAREQKTYEREEKVRSGLASAIGPDGKVDPQKAYQAYLSAGDVEGAMGFQTKQTAARKAELENALAQVETTARLLGSATDPASYAAARQQAQAAGLDISSVPAEYDPEWVRRTQAQALDVKERLQLELQDKKFGEEQRHNRSMEGVAAGGLGVRREALGIVRNREKRIGAGGGGGSDPGLSNLSNDALIAALTGNN